MLKENVVFQNAVHATFGLYGKYFEACKKLGFDMEKLDITGWVESKLLVLFEMHSIPFEVTPLPFRLNPNSTHHKKKHELHRFMSMENWMKAPKNWTC